MKTIRIAGFTVLELIIAIALVGIIMASIYSIYFSSVGIWNFNQDRIDFQQIHRVILDRVAFYVRQAKSIDDNPANTYDRLRITFAEISSDSGKYDGIAYGINDENKLYYRKRFKEKGWSDKLTFISQRVKDLSFKYQDGVLEIQLILINDTGDQEYTFSDKIYPRLPEVITP